MDDWVDVGIFARAKGSTEAKETVLYLQKQHLASGNGTIKLVVDAEPYDVGIDPYNKLIDRVPTDNRKQVTIQ